MRDQKGKKKSKNKEAYSMLQLRETHMINNFFMNILFCITSTGRIRRTDLGMVISQGKQIVSSFMGGT